jgi:S1-C subfamily serine protease
VVQIATQLIRFGELQSLWIGNFRVTKIRINKDGVVSSGLRIVEMQNKGPLFEKGARINDIILSINDETANWSNLTSSLKFATLGENLSMKILNQKNEIVSINFESYNEKSN